MKDTTRLWDLVAAFEEANIRYHELSGKQAKKAKGRSRIAYQKSERNVLEERKHLETSVAQITKAEWLRKIVEKHTVLGKQSATRREKNEDERKQQEQKGGA